jgi:hypothetical protein
MATVATSTGAVAGVAQALSKKAKASASRRVIRFLPNHTACASSDHGRNGAQQTEPNSNNPAAVKPQKRTDDQCS